LRITTKQAKRLQVKARTRISPQLEKCCLLLSANESYARTEEDIEVLTGINYSHSSQQRLVHRQEFVPPQVESIVEEISVDGGKVRVRTPLGQPCEWKDYKAISLHQLASAAKFQDNQGLIDWVNSQPLGELVICLGDGHDGIWNIVQNIANPDQRFEILDWFHLVENLCKIDAIPKLVDKVKNYLWHGKVDSAIEQLQSLPIPPKNFIAYLTKHRLRIPQYGVLQTGGCTIGSGSVESLVKQISHRVKISGAQWEKKNISQVLAHRTAYLNGLFAA
jgi:hypothetical protein